MSATVSYTFVVVGGGIAGVSCAEMLAQIASTEDDEGDSDLSILLITASPAVKKIRNVIQITRFLASFDVEEVNAAEYEGGGRRVSVLQDAVEDIDFEGHVVKTEGGKTIRYSKLCLCHGARPKILPEAEGNPHVLGIRDTESVREFQSRLASGTRRVLIVGNGGIATELAHELRDVEVVWAIRDDSIAATFVDAGAGEFLLAELNRGEEKEAPIVTKRMKYTASESRQASFRGAALGPDWHEGLNVRGAAKDKKVTVEYECEVRRILKPEDKKPDDGVDWKVYSELTNGKVYGCDLVVSATGVVPNGDAAFCRGLEVDGATGGIVVGDDLRTSVADVFAAGDACHARWQKEPLPSHWFQMRLWTQARQLGLYAGQCIMASLKGEPIERDFCFEVFTHATRFFGHKVVLLGLFNAQSMPTSDYEVLLRTTPGKEYIKVVMSKEGRMQGAVLIGETDLEETFENLILNQMDLSQFGEDLLDPDVDIEDFFD